MARDRKLEVCVLNIALTRHQGHAPRPKDYHRLIRAAFETKQPITLRGDRHGLLVQVDKKTQYGHFTGVVATYTDVDVNDSWIDTASGKAAKPDDLEQIHIPARLRPRHRRYNFQFDLATHKLVIETKSEPETGKSRLNLTPKTAASLFNDLFLNTALLDKFGPVGVTVLPFRKAIETIIGWKHAEKIEIQITPPNPDDEDLEERIEQRMNAVNAERWEQNFRAKDNANLAPDDEMKASMRVAARNGYVEAIGHERGKRKVLSTRDMPLLVDTSYDPNSEMHLTVFQRTAQEALTAARGRTPRANRR